ncbi:hypothetical protein T069G_04094 [Trichoderma breve]|uniref:NACHT-NTPase and P-loop NTPases N-terminal domain-containing protein n=1 Tax=Trichoderma breve TaxID=2034170 RepID=A0A9W9EAK2_9HYPO|nr:hypothetical protein T069G_04094 [Trichoderma breve]KAJ4863140.1 hypothetical protein T069G_04094 [Trichoderma breve]
MATNADFKGLYNIIAATIMVCRVAEDISNLPQLYRDIYARLPMIQDLLEGAITAVEREGECSASPSRQALTEMLENCSQKALCLKTILEDVIQVSNSASFMGNLTYATKNVQYGRKVNKLFDTILSDVQFLAAYYSIKKATQMKIICLNNRS